MTKKLVFVIGTLIILPFLLSGQDKSDILLVKLNKHYKENRLILTGIIDDIYINKTKKTIDINNQIVPFANYTAYYETSYNEYYKRNIDIVYLKCAEGNYQLNQKTNTYHSGMGIFFKSKKACYIFINLLEEIKQSLSF